MYLKKIWYQTQFIIYFIVLWISYVVFWPFGFVVFFHAEACVMEPTRTSADVQTLSWRYSTALCCSSASAFRSWLSFLSTCKTKREKQKRKQFWEILIQKFNNQYNLQLVYSIVGFFLLFCELFCNIYNSVLLQMRFSFFS